MTFHQFLDKSDAWVEAGGMENWIFEHPLVIIIGLLVIAGLLGLLIAYSERK